MTDEHTSAATGRADSTQRPSFLTSPNTRPSGTGSRIRISRTARAPRERRSSSSRGRPELREPAEHSDSRRRNLRAPERASAGEGAAALAEAADAAGDAAVIDRKGARSGRTLGSAGAVRETPPAISATDSPTTAEAKPESATLRRAPTEARPTRRNGRPRRSRRRRGRRRGRGRGGERADRREPRGESGRGESARLDSGGPAVSAPEIQQAPERAAPIDRLGRDGADPERRADGSRRRRRRGGRGEAEGATEVATADANRSAKSGSPVEIESIPARRTIFRSCPICRARRSRCRATTREGGRARGRGRRARGRARPGRGRVRRRRGERTESEAGEERRAARPRRGKRT
jgi:ribonuclease E